MKLSLLVFLIGAVSVSVHSQSIEKDVIEWTVNNLNDIESNVDTVYNCKFITYGVKQIEWIQGDQQEQQS